MPKDETEKRERSRDGKMAAQPASRAPVKLKTVFEPGC